MHKSKIGRVILIIALIVVLVRAALWLRNLLQLGNVGEELKPKLDRSRGVLRGIYDVVRSKGKPREEV